MRSSSRRGHASTSAVAIKFNIAKRSATFRLQMVNVFDNPGYGLAGSGIYTSNPGRYVQGYLAVDL